LSRWIARPASAPATAPTIVPVVWLRPPSIARPTRAPAAPPTRRPVVPFERRHGERGRNGHRRRSAPSGATRARARSSTGCPSRADVVVRFQGGHNAGHTLVVGNQTYKLSLLPSGIVGGTLSVIGNGVVLDPWALRDEIEPASGAGRRGHARTAEIADNAP
jgi:hypothetical protein